MREMMYKRPRYYTISHFESIVFLIDNALYKGHNSNCRFFIIFM